MMAGKTAREASVTTYTQVIYLKYTYLYQIYDKIYLVLLPDKTKKSQCEKRIKLTEQDRAFPSSQSLISQT